MSKFKVMEWLRKVRDEMYEETRHMSDEELLAHTKKKAKETDEAREQQKVTA